MFDAELRESWELEELAVDSAEHLLQERQAAHEEAMQSMKERYDFLTKECEKLEQLLAEPISAPASCPGSSMGGAQPLQFHSEKVSFVLKIVFVLVVVYTEVS